MLLAICGRRYSGKTTILNFLLQFLESAVFLPSLTSRSRRPGEKAWFDGGEYIFTTREEIKLLGWEDKLVWRADFSIKLTDGSREEYVHATTEDAFRLALEDDTRWYLCALTLETFIKAYKLAVEMKMEDKIFLFYVYAESEQFLVENGRKRGDSPEKISAQMDADKEWDRLIAERGDDVCFLGIENGPAINLEKFARGICEISKFCHKSRT